MSRIQIIERCDDCKYFEHDPQEVPELWGKNVCHHPNIHEGDEPWILGNSDDVEIPDFCPLEFVDGDEIEEIARERLMKPRDPDKDVIP